MQQGPSSINKIALLAGQNSIEAPKSQVTTLKTHRSRRHSAGGYFLTACAQFKDEDGILVEWVCCLVIQDWLALLATRLADGINNLLVRGQSLSCASQYFLAR